MKATTTATAVPFHVPFIGPEECAAVLEAMQCGWITTGPRTKRFESAFANYIGAGRAVAVNSGTAALHLSLEAAGLKEGDEVLVPTLTFTATAEVVTYFRAKPVLIDVEPQHFNLSLEDAERKTTSKTRIIIPVHFGGHPCPMDEVSAFADVKHLTVVEDAAHAIPAKYRGRNVGALSTLTAFSFYATKTLTTGEGGMVTTDDESLADRIELMRLHGMNRDALKRYSAEGSWRYEIVEAGYKYNLTDIQSAIGLAQLSKCDEMWKRRAEIAQRYDHALSPLDAYDICPTAAHVQHAHHLYVILVDSSVLRIHRDQVIDELRRRGISSAVHFIPLHLHPYYQRAWGYRVGEFPIAEDYFDHCISLPIYPGMADEDVDYVIEGLHEIANAFRR